MLPCYRWSYIKPTASWSKEQEGGALRLGGAQQLQEILRRRTTPAFLSALLEAKILAAVAGRGEATAANDVDGNLGAASIAVASESRWTEHPH